MQPFEWSLPTRIIFGLGRFHSTYKFIKGFGKKAFIVTSRSFLKGEKRSAVLDTLTTQLEKTGIEWNVFGNIEPNPRTTTVDQAAAQAKQFKPRYIIALGGGSVMDAAKCISLLMENEGSIYEYAYQGPGKPFKSFNHALPLVCIPTVAATSSETDFYAVVTDWEQHRKVTVFGEALQPKLSIIDPELTFSVPSRQTVDGAFDMITHVMESYLSTPLPTHFQDRLTEALVETVVYALTKVLEDPKDAHARSQLSWCGAFALSGAFSGREGGWPIHALEHGLSAWTDMSHGRGLSLILPRMMAFDASVIPQKIIEFNQKIFKISPTNDPLQALDEGLITYMKKVGAWNDLSELNFNPSHIKLAELATQHALEIKGIWKKGQRPYLENIKPLYDDDAIALLLN